MGFYVSVIQTINKRKIPTATPLNSNSSAKEPTVEKDFFLL